MTTINVTYTRTYRQTPLVVLDGGPFNGVELTPAQLRGLAADMLAMADAADLRPCSGRHWMEHREQRLVAVQQIAHHISQDQQ